MLAALICAPAVLSSCLLDTSCEAGQLRAFKELPKVDGVSVHLHVSPGVGCTDTVSVHDPDAFVAHYEQAMRDAGWKVEADEDQKGVYGTSRSGGVRVDRLEGHSVGIYALSPSEYG